MSGAPAVTHAAAPPPCAAVGFATGRTIFCAYAARSGGTVLRRSDDGGRTWGAGQPVDPAPDSDVTGIVVSPRYREDATVFVATSRGMFRSADGGRTFATAVGSGVNARFVTAYVEGAGGALPRVALAWASPAATGGEVYDSVTGYRQVPGSPTYNRWFLVPPDFAATRRAVVVANNLGVEAAGGVVTRGGMYAYSCADLACPARGAFLGAGVSNNFGTLPSGRSYVHITDQVRPGTVQVTDDGGTTWRPWTSLTAVLRGVGDPAPHLTVTASPDAPGRLFLYVAGGTTTMRDVRAPAFQLFRSDDGGGTWRRIGHAWRSSQRWRGAATLPWHDEGPSTAARGAFAAARPGGRLYVVAEGGVHCSADLGTTWRRVC